MQSIFHQSCSMESTNVFWTPNIQVKTGLKTVCSLCYGCSVLLIQFSISSQSCFLVFFLVKNVFPIDFLNCFSGTISIPPSLFHEVHNNTNVLSCTDNVAFAVIHTSIMLLIDNYMFSLNIKLACSTWWLYTDDVWACFKKLFFNWVGCLYFLKLKA